MKNKPYPYYDVPDVADLRELIATGKRNGEKKTALYKGANNDEPISFGDVSCLTEQAGTWLLKRGLRSSNIAILGENSTEWVLTYFAVVNSGNVVVPLDTGLTADELAELVKHCECKAVFYSGRYAGIAGSFAEAAGGQGQLMLFRIEDIYEYAEEGRKAIDGGCTDFTEVPIDSGTLASIVYTSGTSGKKKGVMLTHGNLASDAAATCKCVTAGNAQLLLPLHHTFSWASAMLAIFLYNRDLHISKNLRHILQDMQNFKPQNLSSVPMMAEMLYKSIRSNARKQKQENRIKRGMALSRILMKMGIDRRRRIFRQVHEKLGGSIELIICGGAPFDPEIQRALYDLGINVICGYGITECSPVVAVNRNKDFRLGSVGKPLPCNRVRIDDPDENGIGEICVSGSNVMKGYYKDPEATAEAFDGEWFRTGDYGRFDADGFLYITGRKKNLIILANGENISPEELEEKLHRIEYVREVAVYEEDGLITAEFYLDEKAYPEARGMIDGDVKRFNRTVSQSRRIGRIKLRDIPFEKTTTQKIKRNFLNNK